MIEKLLKVILPIKDETGLDIEVYNLGGDRVATTDAESDHLIVAPPPYHAGIVQDSVRDVTLFGLTVGAEQMTGVIAGAGAVSRNYAALVARLIEANFTKDVGIPDRSDDFFALLNGDLNRTQIEQFCIRYVDVVDMYILVFRTENTNIMKEYLDDLAIDGDYVLETAPFTVTLLKSANALEEYSSVSAFAHTVCDNVEQETGARAFVGISELAHDPKMIKDAYQQALTALRLGKLLDPKARVYNIKDYLLVTLFEELPQESVRRCVGTEIDAQMKEIFEDPEMMDTAEQFMLGSLNISETARNMYMHRNTLIYRLDKIEKATGLNIRRFTDAMTFRTLTMLYKLK